MDSGGGISDKLFEGMRPCSSAQETPDVSALVPIIGRSGVMFDGKIHTRPSSECDAAVPVWASLHPDILGVVLRFLPRLVDRASARSVCRHWRAVGRSQVLPPPLPLLALPKFKFSSLSGGRGLTPARRIIPVPTEMEVAAAADVRCMGSCEGWLAAFSPRKNNCFLVKAFSPEVVQLPQLSSDRNLSTYTSKRLPVVNGFTRVTPAVHFNTSDKYVLPIPKLVLSSSPDSGSKYIVAACSASGAEMPERQVALWQPGMMSWHICDSHVINGLKDLAFYQGKLYVLQRSQPDLVAFELEEDDRGIVVSRVECCMSMLNSPHTMQLGIVDAPMSCNIVVWHGLLLLIIRYYGDHYPRHNVLRVRVFALDISRNPCAVTRIHNLGGDCIFVGSNGCKSFPASLHDTVEDDLIYFVPDYWSPYDSFVYNMRNGRKKHFPVKLLSCNFELPEDVIDFPLRGTQRLAQGAHLPGGEDPRHRNTAMDPGTGALARSRDAPPAIRTPRSRGRRREPSRRSVASVQARRSTECPRVPELPTPDAASDPQLRSWADLPADILGLVAGRLPRADDRARLRSVCRAWSGAARVHGRPPPPLPLLVLSNFSISIFCTDGAMTGARRIRLPSRDLASDVRCVGAFDGWLVGVQLNEGRYFGDGRCFLMNAFTGDVIPLPPPSVTTDFADAYSTSLPIANGTGTVHCAVNGAPYVMSFCKVVLSSPPDPDGNCVVAAISVHRSAAKLALWRPGMTSWCVCDGGCISKFSDIALYQGKVYMFSKVTTNLFVFDISEDNGGLMVSHVERCVVELPEVKDSYGQRWNIVEWHGKLLLVVIYLGGTEGWHNICKIGVFEVDLSANPFRYTEINSLDGDCIFISPCSSNSFRACLYDGVEGDLIYFIYPAISASMFDKFVYNMRDGTMVPFAGETTEGNFWAPNARVLNPTWLFPSE
ncbi:hypothetical protein U9M48_001971 [Paspalum notatum var. saurae]|uniref:F-box domain-containing protein n=1 Tax=Paspalum notatum var. saurae TaxID=547442 RepID=A0AAQ3PGF0_PASNO